MTKKALKAFLTSIEHWHQILDLAILNYLSGSDLTEDIYIGSGSCPLCMSFFCHDCPIGISGYHGCEGTPHIEVVDIIAKVALFKRSISFPKFRRAIEKELEFLYSLYETSNSSIR